MDLDTKYGLIRIVNEPTYSFDSTDNTRRYAQEIRLADDSVSSIHGIHLNGDGIVVVGAGGGCSAVHEHSALIMDDKLYLAVGDSVACMSLESTHELLWSVQTDMATCFGIYWAEHQRALISHGELEISRLSTDGVIAWQTSGADIFTEGVRLLPNYIEVVDFNKAIYRLDYSTGEVLRP
ncbi:hypothetical protein K2O51_28060 [Cupriavidus pinatubonensis]|uniref:hypothetical protein n=1 Tax=Cupriavidus pinatubonensis TaxID=248026 RepID=UPI001C730DAE|nr:hypothetical protein [Cupriavidus pinatubonensis]QYY31151.1 hypothetical protein K2O51_28060 [Cupriavidus pinatubonensis]